MSAKPGRWLWSAFLLLTGNHPPLAQTGWLWGRIRWLLIKLAQGVFWVVLIYYTTVLSTEFARIMVDLLIP